MIDGLVVDENITLLDTTVSENENVVVTVFENATFEEALQLLLSRGYTLAAPRLVTMPKKQ